MLTNEMRTALALASRNARLKNANNSMEAFTSADGGWCFVVSQAQKLQSDKQLGNFSCTSWPSEPEPIILSTGGVDAHGSIHNCSLAHASKNSPLVRMDKEKSAASSRAFHCCCCPTVEWCIIHAIVLMLFVSSLLLSIHPYLAVLFQSLLSLAAVLSSISLILLLSFWRKENQSNCLKNAAPVTSLKPLTTWGNYGECFAKPLKRVHLHLSMFFPSNCNIAANIGNGKVIRSKTTQISSHCLPRTKKKEPTVGSLPFSFSIFNTNTATGSVAFTGIKDAILNPLPRVLSFYVTVR